MDTNQKLIYISGCSVQYLSHSMPKVFLLKEHNKLEKVNFIIKSDLKPNGVLIAQKYIGINQQDFSQTNHDIIKTKNQIVVGTEAVGVVEKVGSEVTDFKVGDRVGYCTSLTGAYCTHRTINSNMLYKIPEEIDDITATAIMFKGIVAATMIRKAFFACPGSFIMVYCVTGGIGYVVAQWLKTIRSAVIGTVGGQDKMEISKKYNFQDVLLDHNTNFVPKLMELTRNIGVIAIIDPVGNSLYQKSLSSLSFFGSLVNYGSMSGKIENINPLDLAKKSLYVTCPYFKHYYNTKESINMTINEVFRLVKNKNIVPVINKIYDFDDIPKAYSDLVNRKLVYSNIVKI